MSFATLAKLLTVALGLPTDLSWITTLVSGDVEAVEIGQDVTDYLRSGLSVIVSGKVRVLDGEMARGIKRHFRYVPDPPL